MISILIARCPCCGVEFVASPRYYSISVHKTCGYKCSAKMRHGVNPICVAEVIAHKSVTLDEKLKLQAATDTQRDAMKAAGREAAAKKANADLFQENTCEHCKGVFKVLKSVVRAGKGKYCSTRCHQDARRENIYMDAICSTCGNVYKVRRSAATAGRGKKYCSNPCRSIIQQTIFAPRPPDDPALTLEGKTSYTSLEGFQSAVKALEERGYSFRTAGRRMGKLKVESDFYGLQWGKDSQKNTWVYFFTTKQNVFTAYASR